MEACASAVDPLPVSAGLGGLSETRARNVVVIQVDTLRADRLPMYGSPHDTLPRSGELPWLTVDGLFATAPWTLPASTSMLTGLEVTRHGVTHLAGDVPAHGEAFHTAAERFGDAGYATLVISGNEALPSVPGLFAAFDEIRTAEEDGELRKASAEVRNLVAWIDGLPAETPFYAHLQPMDVHGPYRPGDGQLGTWSDPGSLPFELDVTEQEQLTQLRDAYAAAPDAEARAFVAAQLEAIYDEDILAIDRVLYGLRVALAERGIERDTLVVLTADHGETLLEEDTELGVFFGHGGKTRPELLRVPFLVGHPDLPADDRVECLAQGTDVMPTLLRALGLPDLDGADGVALQDGCREVARSAEFLPDREDRALGELSVTDGHTFVRRRCAPGETLSYDLETDPRGLVALDAHETPALEGWSAELGVAFGVGCP